LTLNTTAGVGVLPVLDDDPPPGVLEVPLLLVCCGDDGFVVVEFVVVEEDEEVGETVGVALVEFVTLELLTLSSGMIPSTHEM